MRLITEKAIEAFLAHKHFTLNNTRVATIEAGEYCYLYLHGNMIARRVHSTGHIEVTTAGWNTTTTKARLNGIPGVQVYTKAGQLYLNGIAWNGDWRTI